MWNTLVEWHQEPIGKPAMAASSEALGNSLGSKRQRRPSVRLGEIGDPPAAIIPEPYQKRKKQSKASYESAGSPPFQSTQPRPGDSAVNSEGNGAMDSSATHSKVAKVTKTRPLVHVNNGNFHEQNSSNDGDDTHEHCMPSDPVSSHSGLPSENHSVLQSASPGGMAGRKTQQYIKTGSKKGRNGKRRRGGPRGLAPIEKLTRAVPSAVPSIIEIDDNDNEKASGMDDTTDPLSDEPYDADTPEGFRDCDLEASEVLKDAKEMSNSQEVDPLEPDTVNRDPVDYQQDYESPLGAADHVSEQDREHIEKNEDREGSANREGSAANHEVGTMGAKRDLPEHTPDAEMKPMTEAKTRPMHEGKAKLTTEANGNLDDREPVSDNADEQLERAQVLVRQHSSLLNGVRGWLQGLGLGKYAEVFETHEVDTEVLPLLTLDDLKEMGITAVGTRRKMFFAIQQLGKGLMGRADSL